MGRSKRELKSLNDVTELIKQLCNIKKKDINISESPHVKDKYDLFITETTNKTKVIYIEVKERMGRYCEIDNFLNYSEKGWMCEEIKWDFLLGKPSRYINLFRIDGRMVIMIWNLNKIQKNTINNNAPMTTDFEKKYKVKKLSTLLKPTQGITYLKNKHNEEYELIEWSELKNKLKNKSK